LLSEVISRCGIIPHDDIFYLQLTETDQLRLRVPDRGLPAVASVRRLLDAGVVVVQLARKNLADSAPTATAIPGMPGASAVGMAASRSFARTGLIGTVSQSVAEDSTMQRFPEEESVKPAASSRLIKSAQHTIVSASRYEQWRVIKVNKMARRQARVLGIDINRITNTKLPGSTVGFFSSSATRVAERLISDIVRVEVPSADKGDEAAKSFAITFVEGMDQVTLRYICETVQDRQEIIAKLSFILRLTNDGNKIVNV
jgi:hypothetical protein